jgi:apolipoprotein N-acyltransferase
MPSFWLGWIAGIIYFGGVLYWITNTMVNYGNLPIMVSFLVLLLLVVYLGLYLAIFAFLMNFIAHKVLFLWSILPPFLWVFLELIRAHILTGFPWASLGYSQFLTLPVIQIADITGVYGVSFLIVWVNSALAALVIGLKGRRLTVSRGVCIGFPPLLVFLLSMAYGWGVMGHYAAPGATDRAIKVGIIQGNIEQDAKWDPVYQDQVVNIYKELTLASSTAGPHLVVWPETATPFFYQSDTKYAPEMMTIARQSGSYLLFGSPAYQIDGEAIKMFNRAYLIAPQHGVFSQYDKIRLVPFGEYVPMKRLLPFVHKIVEGIGDFCSGQEYTVMAIPQGKFSVVICFEIIFPNLIRQFIKRGGEFLVNITNDAWFGRSAASYQHISMGAFRAVENRIFVVRAANTGISAIIEPSGRIVNPTKLFVRTMVRGRIWPKEGTNTFYTTYGDIFAYLCIIGVAVALIAKGIKIRKCNL